MKVSSQLTMAGLTARVIAVSMGESLHENVLSAANRRPIWPSDNIFPREAGANSRIAKLLRLEQLRNYSRDFGARNWPSRQENRIPAATISGRSKVKTRSRPAGKRSVAKSKAS